VVEKTSPPRLGHLIRRILTAVYRGSPDPCGRVLAMCFVEKSLKYFESRGFPAFATKGRAASSAAEGKRRRAESVWIELDSRAFAVRGRRA
jgi:hypothetical protein